MQSQILVLANHSQLTNFFSNQDAREYFDKQFKELTEHPIKKTYISDSRIHIHVPVYTKGDVAQAAEFKITIGRAFPLGQVRLHLVHGFTQIHVSCLKDLIVLALGLTWTHQMNLVEIVVGLQTVVNYLRQIAHEPLQIQKFGIYHLGQTRRVSDLEQHDQTAVCEVTNKSDKKILYVNDTHIILFSCYGNHQKADRRVFLQRYFEIQSLSELYINNQKKSLVLIFRHYRYVKGFTEFDEIEYRFQVYKYEHFVRKLMKSITMFQKTKIGFVASNQMEGSGKTTLEAIEQLEEKLKKEESKELLDKLGSLYEKMLSYYSKRGNCLYLVFVEKIKWLHDSSLRF